MTRSPHKSIIEEKGERKHGTGKAIWQGVQEEALKLVEEKGCKNASEELGIPYYTLYGWIKEARAGNLHLEKRSSSNWSVALPGYIGCGIAGGDWDAVRGIIWDVFKYSPVMLTIVYWYAIGMASYKKSHMLALYTIPCLLQCIVRCSATQLPRTAY